MRKTLTELEMRRLVLQDQLDTEKDGFERNRMGQFATPAWLAIDMLRYGKMLFGKEENVRFLDPALGTGAFYSALLQVFTSDRVSAATGYEIDPHYGDPANELWRETGIDIHLEDFTSATAPENGDKFNLLICNPPYIRHHHIGNGDKRRLQLLVKDICGAQISGLAGLYCYFLGLSHSWMADGGLAGWLIPSEFMDVNYGRSIKRYLLDEVTLVQIHRFDPKESQFRDALVSSAVVWIRNKCPRPGHGVRFTFGGTLVKPELDRVVPLEELRRESKWTRYPKKGRNTNTDGPVLSDFFRIKRGLVTGKNSFFILSDDEIEGRGLPLEAFKPILPSPRYLANDEIRGDREGNPLLERRLFLLDPPWTEVEIQKEHPALWLYLEEGKNAGIPTHYICRHRAPWYRQEHRPPAPFVCTYLGRGDQKTGRTFRFILNHSQATAANVYLMMYPHQPMANMLRKRPELKRQIWEFLNKISPQAVLWESRVYGGGLYKLEPKELGNVPAAGMAELLPELVRPRRVTQQELLSV